MPLFEFCMRVTHEEIWTVEAESEEDAAKKIDALHEDVNIDDTGGEIIDWRAQGGGEQVED